MCSKDTKGRKPVEGSGACAQFLGDMWPSTKITSHHDSYCSYLASKYIRNPDFESAMVTLLFCTPPQSVHQHINAGIFSSHKARVKSFLPRCLVPPSIVFTTTL